MLVVVVVLAVYELALILEYNIGELFLLIDEFLQHLFYVGLVLAQWLELVTHIIACFRIWQIQFLLSHTFRFRI